MSVLFASRHRYFAAVPGQSSPTTASQKLTSWLRHSTAEYIVQRRDCCVWRDPSVIQLTLTYVNCVIFWNNSVKSKPISIILVHLTLVDYKFAHFTCKMSPHYLVKRKKSHFSITLIIGASCLFNLLCLLDKTDSGCPNTAEVITFYLFSRLLLRVCNEGQGQ